MQKIVYPQNRINQFKSITEGAGRREGEKEEWVGPWLVVSGGEKGKNSRIRQIRSRIIMCRMNKTS